MRIRPDAGRSRADPADIELERVVIQRNIRIHFNITVGFEMLDTVRKLPYLSIHGSGLILKLQGIIALPCFRCGCDLCFAKINLRDPFTFLQVLNKMHVFSFFLLN